MLDPVVTADAGALPGVYAMGLRNVQAATLGADGAPNTTNVARREAPSAASRSA